MKEKNNVPKIGPERQKRLEELCARLGIKMEQYGLLNMALTHSSYAHEAGGYPSSAHNERLEFLGDSVLSLVVSTYIFNRYGHFDEGRLTKLRAQVVCEESLHLCAMKMGLGEYLRMGHGEMAAHGNEKPSILADAFEAVLGAYYLDQGFAAAEKYLLFWMEDEIDAVCRGDLVVKDNKTMLQEKLKTLEQGDIVYKILETIGPDHDRTFVSGVFVRGELKGKGSGRTKKESEQNAAKEALAAIRK